MAPRALGAGGADGEVRPSLTERPPRWLPTGWIGSHLLGSRSRLRFALPPPRIHLFSSLRGMTDIRTSTPAPFLWSARATDRLHSPLHLCLWPHHSPRLRSPPGPSRHPRVPLSAPRTTPDSSSSSCIGYKSPGTARTIPVNIPFPNLSGQCPLSKRLQSHQFRLTPVTVSSDSTGLLTTHHRPIAGSHALVSRTSPPAAVVILSLIHI